MGAGQSSNELNVNEEPTPPRRVYECNGIELPFSECRPGSFFNRISGNVVAVDFGTTFCSMFYCLDKSTTIEAVLLDGCKDRVPTAILLNDRGEILAFGDQAGSQYEDKKGAAIVNRHYYFHHMKMLLERDKKISRNSRIKADNGQEFYLVEVIAMILKHMKDRLLSYEVRDRMEQVDPNNFTWVLTVPAIWEAEGKQMMREAAYLAGIASTGLEIARLTATNDQMKKPDETKVSSDKLILALEPEAAALYCLDDAKKTGDPSANASNYVVIDAGGGTLDITAHKLTKVSGSHQIEVIMSPCGNNAGGNMVNKEFMTYLANLVKDKEFSRMLKAQPDEYAMNVSALNKVNECFERVKVRFGDGHINDTVVSLELQNYRFMEKYKKALQSAVKYSDTLIFDTDTFKTFFKNILKKAMKLIKASLIKDDLHKKLDAVFCVGGFGGCKLFHDEVKDLIESINPSIKLYRPQKHQLAVVLGAIAFGKTPNVIKSRKAGATYGTSTTTKFIPGRHKVEHEFYDDDNRHMCDNLFSPYVLTGDMVHVDQCLYSYFYPVLHNQKSVKFNLYRTEDTVDIPYTHKLIEPLTTTDKKFEIAENLRQVGGFTMTLPEDTKKLDKGRKIRLTFDFAHTEIHVEAYDCDYDKKISCTIDFLTM